MSRTAEVEEELIKLAQAAPGHIEIALGFSPPGGPIAQDQHEDEIENDDAEIDPVKAEDAHASI